MPPGKELNPKTDRCRKIKPPKKTTKAKEVVQSQKLCHLVKN